ncbi:queuine tRNA-ribosyltransferase accessory subunit 2-like [Mytilus edulis]|uniref:queuine tRNA-ribosyltransferase accessory subunit 2-like n=1 Tax=Mytilus edulis TaxID=6550 RepID=UPI0039EEAD77
MKFSVQNVKNGCRLGLITDLGKNGTKSIETPMCMLYTRGGNAPHLTLDVLKKIQRVPPMAHMYLSSLAEHSEAVTQFKEGIANFCGMQDFAVYCSLHDPATEVPSGYNEKSGTAIWTKGGKYKLDVIHFMQIQEAFQPDICEALYDGDTNKDSTRKRLLKAMDRTLNYLDEIQDKWKSSQKLQKTALFGVIEGGFSIQERQKSAHETVTRNVDGFVLAGFHNNGPKTEMFDLSQVTEICQKTMECLPENKPRLMQNAWRPDKVMEGIALGIDMFDSSYPYIVTERGCGLVFKFNVCASPEEQEGNGDHLLGFQINLADKKYVDDFGPLLEGCTCYACQNFTRSYINHLLNTSELLSSVLLMIHNFHHYFEFFHQIRQSLQDGNFDELNSLIQKQKPVDS